MVQYFFYVFFLVQKGVCGALSPMATFPHHVVRFSSSISITNGRGWNNFTKSAWHIGMRGGTRKCTMNFRLLVGASGNGNENLFLWNEGWMDGYIYGTTGLSYQFWDSCCVDFWLCHLFKSKTENCRSSCNGRNPSRIVPIHTSCTSAIRSCYLFLIAS